MMSKKTEIYQLAPHSGILMEGYVIKTPNDKIIVIDGGNDFYLEKPYLPSAIRAILGLEEGDYFEVDAWFLSHGHSDHYGEISMMLRNYDETSNYKIHNIYFDFPNFEDPRFDESDYDLTKLATLKAALNTYAKVNKIDCGDSYFDYLNGRVVNANSVADGLTITVDGVKLEILQTWSYEDDQVNGNSMVIKVFPEDPNGKNCLFLNDVSIVSGARLLKTYGEKLKSDIVQMAHHGQAGADKDVYDTIDAKIRLWPIPFWVWENEETYQIGAVRAWVGVDQNNVKESDVVSCRYNRYPGDNYDSVAEWKACIDGMKIVLED